MQPPDIYLEYEKSTIPITLEEDLVYEENSKDLTIQRIFRITYLVVSF